ncbi:MAG: response regulator [Gammaproteobacteria bacterium]
MSTILTVDDSASMRQMVAFSLKSGGHAVLEAFDGVDGLEKAKEHAVDAFIVDVNMPRMDGISLVQELRAIPEYAHTPILMLTTESSDEKKRQGRDAGATGWIVKPFNPEQLVNTLRRLIT